MKPVSNSAWIDKIIAVLFVFLILFVVLIIGLDSILVVGTDIVFWIIFAVLLLFSVALTVDTAHLLFRPFFRMSAIKRNILLSTWPSFEAFRRGRSDNPVEDFFVLTLRGYYLKRYGREPDSRSFRGDEAVYMSFRRRVLPHVVLFSRYRPFVEDLYMKMYSLYRTDALDPKLKNTLKEAMKLSSRTRQPFGAIYTFVRILLISISFGKLRIKKPMESDTESDERKAVVFASNPKAFIRLMDEHFFTIFADVPDLIKARKIAGETAKKTRQRYEKDVSAIASLSPPSSSCSGRPGPKEREKNSAEESESKKAKTEQDRKKGGAAADTESAQEIFDRTMSALQQDGPEWNDIGVFLDGAAAKLHNAVMKSAEQEKGYQLLARLQVYRARMGTFNGDFDRGFKRAAERGADAVFEENWLRKAIKMLGSFGAGDPEFEKTACRFYLFDEEYHAMRAKKKKAEGNAS